MGTGPMVSVFISHKTSVPADVKAAKFLQQELNRHGNDQVKAFICEVDVHNGAQWLKQVKDSLRQSDLFILLYTSPDHDWAWCLYEAGLFTDLQHEKTKVVCVHHEFAQPPKQLDYLKPVKGVPHEIFTFFSDLFIRGLYTGGRPLNGQVRKQ